MYSYHWGQKQTYYRPHNTKGTNLFWTESLSELTDRKPLWSTSLPHSDWPSKIIQPNHSLINGSTSSVNLKRKRVKTRYITLNISIHCSPLTWLESNFGSEFLICFFKNLFNYFCSEQILLYSKINSELIEYGHRATVQLRINHNHCQKWILIS